MKKSLAARPLEEVQTAPKRLNTREEAADFFGVCVRQVDKWIADGSLNAVRYGRLVRVPGSELERLEQEGIQ